ncbi:MAG TPA: hypothetical protein VFL59_13650 [Candidatus Nanopelagicales bacterium]|nr:hypothetical protein [Candidatus Nanopelagicales bacterium]
MSETRTCANCGDPLPADQPVGHDYCERCATAWTGGPTASASTGTERTCRNCGTALPPTHPAGNDYCGTCAAAWQRGRS